MTTTVSIKNSLDIINYAMEMEKRGQDFYLSYMEKVKNPHIKMLFKRLSEIELDHYNFLKEHYDHLQKHNSWNLNINFTDGEDIFTNEEIDIKSLNLEHEISDLPILRMAYLIENDFVNFYEKAMNHIQDEDGKKILNFLAKWETSHRDGFFKEYKVLMENNWFDQNFYPF